MPEATDVTFGRLWQPCFPEADETSSQLIYEEVKAAHEAEERFFNTWVRVQEQFELVAKYFRDAPIELRMVLFFRHLVLCDEAASARRAEQMMYRLQCNRFTIGTVCRGIREPIIELPRVGNPVMRFARDVNLFPLGEAPEIYRANTALKRQEHPKAEMSDEAWAALNLPRITELLSQPRIFWDQTLEDERGDQSRRNLLADQAELMSVAA